MLSPARFAGRFYTFALFCQKTNADLVVANGENAQRGFGIGKAELEALALAAG